MKTESNESGLGVDTGKLDVKGLLSLIIVKLLLSLYLTAIINVITNSTISSSDFHHRTESANGN